MTAEIEVNQPIQLTICLMDIEEYLPSFRVELSCQLPHPTGTFTYGADDIWFTCEEWDRFVSELHGFARNQVNLAILRDASTYFQFSLSKQASQVVVSIACREPESGAASGRLTYQTTLDAAAVAALEQAFAEFPRWWH